MGRRSIYQTDHEKIEATKKYQQTYYETKKVVKLKMSVIENAIDRIKRDDKYIKMFLDSIGHDKIQLLLNE